MGTTSFYCAEPGFPAILAVRICCWTGNTWYPIFIPAQKWSRFVEACTRGPNRRECGRLSDTNTGNLMGLEHRITVFNWTFAFIMGMEFNRNPAF